MLDCTALALDTGSLHMANDTTVRQNQTGFLQYPFNVLSRMMIEWDSLAM